MKDRVVSTVFITLVVLILGAAVWQTIRNDEAEQRQQIVCDARGKVLVLYQGDPRCADFDQLEEVR